MKVRHAVAALGLLLSPVLSGAQDNATFEISEQALNKVISRLGTMSDGGVAQPYNVHQYEPEWEFCYSVGLLTCVGNTSRQPGLSGPDIPLVLCKGRGDVAVLPAGEPISWHWWVSNAFVEVKDGAMTFTATVVSRVGPHWSQVTKTVPASIEFEPSTSRLHLFLQTFRVPLALPDAAGSLDVEPVRVDNLYALSLDIHPQSFSVPLPSGERRDIDPRIVSATTEYPPGRVRLVLDAEF